MSDETTTAATAEPTEQVQGAKPSDMPETLGDPGKKALAAERDARKAAEGQAAEWKAKLDAIEKANMSELEKAQATAAEYRANAEKANADALRWRIAAKYGISDEDAETFLGGSDEASLIRQAERLRALAGAQHSPTTPLPDRSQGGSGVPLALNSDGLELALRDKLGC